VTPSDRWDWSTLYALIAQDGIRNSLLLAPMPTKSTSHILGWNEAFEPFHAMLFKARVLAGEYDLLNRHLISVLKVSNIVHLILMTYSVAECGTRRCEKPSLLTAVPSRMFLVFQTI
jgi:hypothetical protein